MQCVFKGRLPLLGALLVLLLGSSAVAGVLDDVDRVNGLLRRAEANIESVAASIGNRTTPPRGAAAKLAANRLQQALGDLTPAGELLAKIPEGTAGRAEAAARYSAAVEEYNRLQAILTGSDAPASAPGTDDSVRLDYRQEELLRNATFHVREVESNAQQLTAAVEPLRAIDDQLSINHREVAGLLGVVENAQRKSGFARDGLSQLPDNGRGVAGVRQRLINADAQVVTAADYLRPLHARLQDLINPANYPQFGEDERRLRELSIMFADPMILQTDRSRAAEAIRQAEAARAECVRIAQRYARLMEQQTDQGRAIEGVGNGFLQNLEGFLAAADAQRAALPGEIRDDLATAQRYADEAVAEQKPLWFTGGIPQVMGFAEDRVELLTVLDPAAGEELRAELDGTRASIRAQADSLRELIIRENRMPNDAFRGDDREKAIETAVSAWRVQQPEFELLAVRIPAEQWARETKWTYSNGTWYFVDRSRLQVRLIVADHQNAALAIDRPVTVWKDHQKGDSMIGTPLWGFEDELQPSSYLLREHVP